MNNRRGLTLLEVLLAAAMLAVIAATCVPLLQNVASATGQSSWLDCHIELHQLADEVLADPKKFGIEDLQKIERYTLLWPDSFAGTAVSQSEVIIEQLTSEQENVDHVWLVFSCEDSFVLRSLKIQNEEEKSS